MILLGLGAVYAAGIALAAYTEFRATPTRIRTTTDLNTIKVIREYTCSRILRRTSLRHIIIQCNEHRFTLREQPISPGDVLICDENGTRLCRPGTFWLLSQFPSISHAILKQVAMEERDSDLRKFLRHQDR